MAVSVLRTFVSGDRVVEFEPKDVDAEEIAQEATEGVNHAFMREQDGYKVLQNNIEPKSEGLYQRRHIATLP